MKTLEENTLEEHGLNVSLAFAPKAKNGAITETGYRVPNICIIPHSAWTTPFPSAEGKDLAGRSCLFSKTIAFILVFPTAGML